MYCSCVVVYNIKKAQGAKHDGTRQNHDSNVNAISRGLAWAKIQHKGGRSGHPRTCKNIFSGISAPKEEDTRAYRHIIPDLEINGRPLDEGPLAGKISLVDAKTLSPCDAFTDNQTSEPNYLQFFSTDRFRCCGNAHALCKQSEC